MKNASHEERFWEKVHKTDTCWLWTGAVDSAGYGRFRYFGRVTGAHRLSLSWHTEIDVWNDLEADHTNDCRNSLCVKPEHLRWATESENNQNHGGARSDSSTGIRGVFRTPSGRHFARVMFKGVRYQTPVSDDLDYLEAWVLEKRLELMSRNDSDAIRAKELGLLA